MTKTDQQWAEKLLASAIDDAALGDNEKFLATAFRILAEVRHQEREACAQIAETKKIVSVLGQEIAATIRSRKDD